LLEHSARSLHFIDRTYAAILSPASHDSEQQREIENLGKWLGVGVIKQKKFDAIKLLTALSSPSGLTAAPSRPAIFELTDAFAYDLKYCDLDGIFDKHLY
jgi:hypothetical protein